MALIELVYRLCTVIRKLGLQAMAAAADNQVVTLLTSCARG